MSSTLPLPRFPGPLVRIGDRDLVLPPMSLATRGQDKAARLAVLSGASDLDEDEICTQIVLATLQRNYPDLTLEQFRADADQVQVMTAYITLQEEEAKHMAALGNRVAAGRPVVGAPAAP